MSNCECPLRIIGGDRFFFFFNKCRSILRSKCHEGQWYRRSKMWDPSRSSRPSRIVRLTCFFRSNPLSLLRSPLHQIALSLSFSSARARARSRSPSLFLHDRPDPVSLSLSPSATMRACVWVRGSAVELVNGRTRTRSPLLASAARSLSVRALRGHREVLVSQNP